MKVCESVLYHSLVSVDWFQGNVLIGMCRITDVKEEAKGKRGYHRASSIKYYD